MDLFNMIAAKVIIKKVNILYLLTFMAFHTFLLYIEDLSLGISSGNPGGYLVKTKQCSVNVYGGICTPKQAIVVCRLNSDSVAP